MTMLNVDDILQEVKDDQKFVSIIIPTFNESMNIRNLLTQIQRNIPAETNVEIIIVDDNSPDGTGNIVEKYIEESSKSSPQELMSKNVSIRIVHRKEKSGLISALVNGIGLCKGKNVLIMDADFSHPPEVINKMIGELKKAPNCIIIGSRYVNGGGIDLMSFKRFLLSQGDNWIA